MTIESTTRSIFSSTSAHCDPEKGLNAIVAFEYDDDGLVSKIHYGYTYRTLTYDNVGRVVSSALYAAVDDQYRSLNELISEEEYGYDSRGNLVSVDGPDGVTTYEYDDKPNPYYQIRHKPQFITPFNVSPNNVIRGHGFNEFERTFTYHASGLPATESSGGLTYEFVY